MILMYKGGRGRGKTLSMVMEGLLYLLDGYRILRNFECAFGEYISNDEILAIDKNSEIYNCVMMIDEIQVFFDNRRSMNPSNLRFANFIQQARKRNIIILCTTQFSNTVDLRINQHLDIIVYPNYKKEYDVCEMTYIDITRLQDNALVQDFKPAEFKMVFDAKPIYPLYNTAEMIV